VLRSQSDSDMDGQSSYFGMSQAYANKVVIQRTPQDILIRHTMASNDVDEASFNKQMINNTKVGNSTTYHKKNNSSPSNFGQNRQALVYQSVVSKNSKSPSDAFSLNS
jgi:hypothetical protein